MPINLKMYYYHGHPGNCSDPKYQPSGAYVFRPNTSSIYNWPAGPGQTLVVCIMNPSIYGKYTRILSTWKTKKDVTLHLSSAYDRTLHPQDMA